MRRVKARWGQSSARKQGRPGQERAEDVNCDVAADLRVSVSFDLDNFLLDGTIVPLIGRIRATFSTASSSQTICSVRRDHAAGVEAYARRRIHHRPVTIRGSDAHANHPVAVARLSPAALSASTTRNVLRQSADTRRGAGREGAFGSIAALYRI
jgi:hypothetical protein